MIGWHVNDDEWTRTNIHTSSKIQTHYLSIQAIKACPSDCTATGTSARNVVEVFLMTSVLNITDGIILWPPAFSLFAGDLKNLTFHTFVRIWHWIFILSWVIHMSEKESTTQVTVGCPRQSDMLQFTLATVCRSFVHCTLPYIWYFPFCAVFVRWCYIFNSYVFSL
jgi:hypothetical protein